MTLAELNTQFPSQAEPVVDGLLRRGETMNIIAAPKVGKTWLAHGLARSVATGEDWIDFPTTQGRVLIVDVELRPHELRKRMSAVCGDMMSGLPIDVLPVRGRSVNVEEVAKLAKAWETGRYSLIVLDALYRLLPKGTNENDNGAMMAIYNCLDGVAMTTDAAIVVVHHSSKGDQSSKSITDVGSGAGSIARAADTHLAIRPHQKDGMAVLQAVCRSFKAPDDMSIQWEYPYWTRCAQKPQLANRRPAKQQRQKPSKTADMMSIGDQSARPSDDELEKMFP